MAHGQSVPFGSSMSLMFLAWRGCDLLGQVFRFFGSEPSLGKIDPLLLLHHQ